MTEGETDAGNVDLVGGRLCLDFTNSVSRHIPAVERERLNNYSDLVVWSRHAGIVTNREARRLSQDAAGRPAEAAAVFERALALREAFYRIFVAISRERSPREDDLSLLNAALSQAMAHSRIVAAADGFRWDWLGGEAALERPLWPLARSAADLLTSGELVRVRECEGDTCNWLFVDTSKNHSRRWCQMKDCGNRAKARRHYHRQRAAAGA